MDDVSGSYNRKVILREIFGNNNIEVLHTRQNTDLNQDIISVRRNSFNIIVQLRLFLYEIFLPQGYPHSVSEDYTWYQIWDTLQACCSTFCGMMAIQSVLLGVGVGRDNATPLAAAVAWFTKDGIGMISGIGFAWLKGTSLDSDCKKWRLFADVLNDVAFCIELSISALQDHAVLLLCISSALKAVVGVAGGATRAALTRHQAVRGNTADVAAKDGSQETLVNLLTMLSGIWLINTTPVQQSIWLFMGGFVTLHLYFNYRAVKCLRLQRFNEERFLLVIREYLLTGNVPTVSEVNEQESIIIGIRFDAYRFCGQFITLGKALSDKRRPVEDFAELLHDLKMFDYLILPNESANSINVAMGSNISDNNALKGFFHAVIVALLDTQIPNLPKGSPLLKIYNRFKEERQPNRTTSKSVRLFSNKIMDNEFRLFADACVQQGWDIKEHVLNVDQWRLFTGPQDQLKKEN